MSRHHSPCLLRIRAHARVVLFCALGLVGLAYAAAAPTTNAEAATGAAPVTAADATAAPATAPASEPAVTPPRPTLADMPVDESTYQNQTTCINLRDIRQHIVVDDRNLVFELRRGRYVLSQLMHRCEYLRQQDTISLNTTGGSRLCALDEVSVLERDMNVGRSVGGLGTIGGFVIIGRCRLGPFEEITKEQVAALRDAVKARNRDRVDH